MLLVNGQQKEIKPAELKSLGFKEYNTFKLLEKFKRWDKDNKRWRYPSGRGVQCSYTVYDPKEKKNIEVQYYETKREEKGKIIYEPSHLFFNNGSPIFVKNSNPELFWFLYHCPEQADSPYSDSNKTTFILEDLKKEAKQKADKGRAEAAALNYIFSESTTDEQLAVLASSLLVSGAQHLDRNELQVELEPKAKKDPVGFMNKVNSADVKIRAIAKQAQDVGVLWYDPANKSWFLVDGKERERWCGVNHSQDIYEAIVNHLKDNSTHLEYLGTAIQPKKVAEEV